MLTHMSTPKMEEWLCSSGNESAWGARECNMFSDFLICCSDLRGHSHEFSRFEKYFSDYSDTPMNRMHSNTHFSNQTFWHWVELSVTVKSDALSEMILTFLFLCTKTFIVQSFVLSLCDFEVIHRDFYHNMNITVFRKWKCGSNCFVCLCFQVFSFVNISCKSVAVVCRLGFGIISAVWLPKRSQLGYTQLVPKLVITPYNQANKINTFTKRLNQNTCFVISVKTEMTDFDVNATLSGCDCFGSFGCIPPTVQTTHSAVNPLN